MWVRTSSELPEKLRVVLVIDTKKHPALASFINQIPFRKATGVLISMLETGLAAATAAGGNRAPGKPEHIQVSEASPLLSPVVTAVPRAAHASPHLSAAAEGLVSRLDDEG